MTSAGLDVPADRQVLLPSVEGLASGGPGLCGVLVSHPHIDHYGLAGQVHSDVPIYVSGDAALILDAARPVRPDVPLPTTRGFLEDRKELRLGPVVWDGLGTDYRVQ